MQERRKLTNQKMEIEIKRISMETIKPSSPIPKPLQKHPFSSLDQSSPPIFIPLVYFYESNPKITNSEKSEQLKKSLSKVLSRFYPVAGRVVGNHYIDCNDGGAPFSEAEANCRLSQLLPNPDHNVMAKFLPNYKVDEPQDFCLAVQATYFRCGGFALGILILHKVADGLSVVMFVNSWAAAAAKHGDSGGMPLPKFDAAAYFPQLQDTSGLDPTSMMTKEDLATRLITFPATKIAALREMYTASGGGLRPSRVEAVSAFIWSQFLSATGLQSDPSKIYMVSHSVNIRSRLKPPLSEYHFGNAVGTSIAMPAAGDGGVEVVQKIRAAIKAVDGAFVVPDMIENVLDDEKLVYMSFSSPCGPGFSFYEADFGWGTPIRVVQGRYPYKNMVFLWDTKSGGGIDALIHLTKQDMVKFEELHLLKSNL